MEDDSGSGSKEDSSSSASGDDEDEPKEDHEDSSGSESEKESLSGNVLWCIGLIFFMYPLLINKSKLQREYLLYLVGTIKFLT